MSDLIQMGEENNDYCEDCHHPMYECNCTRCCKCKKWYPLNELYERNGVEICENCLNEREKNA